MSWVKDDLEKERQKSKAAVPTPPKPVPTISPNEELWRRIGDCIDRDVREFNMGGSREFAVSHMGNDIIQLTPKQTPPDTLKLECSRGTVSLVTTISKPGVPRLATFKMQGGKVVFSGQLTGGPKPPEAPMDADEFSRAVLEPFLFPEL